MSRQGSFWRTSNGLASIVLVGVASYFLLIEHRDHLFQWLPFLLLALCPLMHVFMHGGHGEHGDDHKPHSDDETKGPEEEAYRRGVEDGKKQSNQHNDKGE